MISKYSVFSIDLVMKLREFFHQIYQIVQYAYQMDHNVNNKN